MLSSKLARLFRLGPSDSSFPLPRSRSFLSRLGESGWLLNCALAALLVLWGVAGRWFLETPNFKSVGAAALLAGLLLRDWRWAVAVPLTSLAISDWRLGGYQWNVVATVYGSTCLYALLGIWASRKPCAGPIAAVARTLGLTLIGSLQFFLLTNLAVWLWSGWYGSEWSELVRCFWAAVPFYKWTLLSDLAFFAAPLASWELLRRPLGLWLTGSSGRPISPALIERERSV
jgi:hypothetical protein